MRQWRNLCALAAFAAASVASRSSDAAFHLWAIKEIFSNQNGDVQFIELFTTGSSEVALTGHSLEATSDGVLKTFTLDHAVSAPSTNKHLLFATAGFGALQGGVTPDYFPLPSNFFNPNAASISINWAHSTDVATFAGSSLPKDGVNSLTDTDTTPFGGPDNLVAGVNSPTNYAGANGSINLSPPALAADFNGDGVVNGTDLAAWKTGFGATGGAATKSAGNADADNDVDGADFLLWQGEFGAPAAGAAIQTLPEPTVALLAVVAAGTLLCVCGRR